MANPNPDTSGIAPHSFQPGTSGNPKGRPKGIKSFANVVRELLGNEQILQHLTNSKNTAWIDALPTKNPAFAVVAAMVVKALEGDAHAADWLRKTGFGDKLDITTDGHELPVPILGGLSLAPVKTTPKPATNTPAPVKATAPKGTAAPVPGIAAKPPVVSTNKPQGSPVPTTIKPLTAAPQITQTPRPRTVDAPVALQPPKLSAAMLESRKIAESAIVPPTNGK